MSNEMFDVAIVGFGPTGAVAAGLLGGRGLKVWVCDKSEDVYDKPRAIALDHEIMRVFQELSLVEKIEPFTEPFTNSEFFGVDGQLIKCMSTVAEPFPLAYTPSLVFSQPPVEEALRAHVHSLPNVTVSLGQTVTAVTQDSTSATLTVVDAQGHSSQVQARYVIGCDGASSFVRSQVGLTLEDLGFDEPWLVVDVLVNEQGLKKLPKTSVQYCEPERPCTLVIGPKNHRRWEISINPGEDPQHLATPEGTWPLLARWLTPADATLWRQASYRFHALVAKDWRQGRVFLAGDAAHQQPPFLGQGMCQGVRDAANLSWKLAEVLSGRAQASLLDTYGEERKAHVTELTRRIKGIGQLVGQRDVAKARARDAQLLAECGGVVQPMPRQNVQPALAHGCLVPDTAAAGTLFPQAWWQQGAHKQRMDTVLGTGWRVFVAPGADAGFEAALAAAPAALQLKVVRLGTPEAPECDGVLAAWFQANGCQAAWVRPDHYVFATAHTAEELTTQQQALRAYFS